MINAPENTASCDSSFASLIRLSRGAEIALYIEHTNSPNVIGWNRTTDFLHYLGTQRVLPKFAGLERSHGTEVVCNGAENGEPGIIVRNELLNSRIVGDLLPLSRDSTPPESRGARWLV
jgi:hypothetical protein